VAVGGGDVEVEGLCGALDERGVAAFVANEDESGDLLVGEIGEGSVEVGGVVFEAVADHEGLALGVVGDDGGPICAGDDDDALGRGEGFEGFGEA